MPPRLHIDRALASSRASSEDRAEVFAHGDDTVIVVADGAGGVSGGGDASDLFVDAIRAAVGRSELDLVAVFGAVDRVLASRDAGETTAIVVVIGPRGLSGVSVGDSEAWVVTSHAVDDLTASQTRSRLGSGRAEPVAFTRATLDGTLVVGTDGLFKYASIDAIARAARETGSANAMIDLVRLRSGALPDDVAVVLGRAES